MSEADTKRFFVNFDTAFLTLYPQFITEFNDLLRPGEEIYPQREKFLTQSYESLPLSAWELKTVPV